MRHQKLPVKLFEGRLHMGFFVVSRSRHKEQVGAALSFCGGYPFMPGAIEWPHCRDCYRPLTFFFQLQLPPENPIGSKIVALFFCVECASEQTSYPRLETRPILGRGFAQAAEEVLNPNLWDYQVNFRVILFDSNDSLVRRDDLRPKVQFREYKLIPKPKFSRAHLTVYGQPPKEADPDDTAFFYRGTEVTKVLYIPRGYTFPKAPDAPQQRMPPMGGVPWIRDEGNYVLFTGSTCTVLVASLEGQLVPFLV